MGLLLVEQDNWDWKRACAEHASRGKTESARVGGAAAAALRASAAAAAAAAAAALQYLPPRNEAPRGPPSLFLNPLPASSCIPLHPNNHRFKDAVKECSHALALSPSSVKALQRRARSLEQQGLYKQALSDMQLVNRSPSATDETRESERRLRDTLAGRRPSSAGARAAPQPGAATAERAAARLDQQRQAAAAQQRQSTAVAARVQLGDETRTVLISGATTYAALLEAVRAKFPDAAAASGGLKLAFTDADGDSVTITSRFDVRAAHAAAVEAAAAGGAPKGGLAPMAPTLRVTAVPCAEADAPPPPPEEVAQLEAVRRHQEALKRRAQEQQQQQQQGQEQQGQQQQQDGQQQQQQNGDAEQEQQGEEGAAASAVELDDWLADFSDLYRQEGGRGADDAALRAAEAALRRPEAGALLAAAEERFRDVACAGLLNWGNVSVCAAHKLADEAALSGSPLDAKAAAAAFDAAEAKYREALALNPDYVDALAALGQLEFERLKLDCRLLVKPSPPPPPPTGDADADKAAAEAATAANNAALHEALKRVERADVEAAAPRMAAVAEWYGKAKKAAAAADARRRADHEARAAKRAAAGEAGAKAPAEDPAATLAANTLIAEANCLYEWSQLLVGAGAGGWRAPADAAVALYREAHCPEDDIAAALKNHVKAAELLPPAAAAASDK